MSVNRPNVIVFQEFETLTVTPDIPDLDVMIVGEAKQILDYLDDKEDCYADEYGTFEANSPITSPSAVVLSGPPNAYAGIELDADSVGVYFDEARIILVAWGVAAQDADYASGDNLFRAHTTAGGVHFGNEEVAAGDVLLTNSPGTDDYVMTVKEVIYTLNDFGGTLDFVTVAGVQPGDTVTLENDSAPGTSPRDGSYTVAAVRDDANLEFTGLSWTGHYEGDFGGTDTTLITITDASGVIKPGFPATVELADYGEIRTTSDFAGAAPASSEWRVEREVDDIALVSTQFSVDDNEITVDAAITVDLSSSLMAKDVSYAKLYVEYTAKRTDLQDISTLSNFSEMEVALDKYDSRNPLFVGAMVAKANTTTAVKVYGVTDDTLPAYLDFIDRVSTQEDIYAIAPLTQQSSILAALNNMAETLADPTYALDNGTRQKFRAILGSTALVTSKTIVNAAGSVSWSQVVGSSPGDISTMTIVLTVPGTIPAIDLQALGVIPGDKVIVTVTSGGPTVYTYTVAQVNGALVLETDGVTATHALVATDKFQITNAAGTVDRYAEHTLVGAEELDLTASALDDLFLDLACPSASFLTNGVIAGDIIQMPQTVTGSSFTGTLNSWIIDSVISNERVRVMNNGTNTSQLANEVPHYSRRTDGVAIVSGTGYMQVIRNLDKTQQIDEMLSVATSFASKRMVLCYPNSVDVTSLVDGSKTRSVSTVPEPADAQPGYYLACAVGGQTAGNPPQQGFTNLGIAGIDRIYNSSDYFNEEQITDLSNGGVYVFIQDTPTALPYSVHEVTTDVSTLEFSEYMVLKDFDFVARTFLDTLVPFLGTWNVNAETIEFIRQALYAVGDTLKSRYVARIGAPLNDYSIAGVEESTISRDRIEAYVDVDLPMVLNTIGVHLVA